MNLENRKLNLINWISSMQEEDTLRKIENIQKEGIDWWDNVSETDKTAINDGLDQLDTGDLLTRDQARTKIKERFNF